MFQNPILETLSISGPKMMSSFHAIIISLLLYVGSSKNPSLNWALGILLFASAMLTWTLAEYTLHRYVFHFIKDDSKLVKAFHYTLHGYHHQVPDDANRLFMPPLPAIIILSLFLGFFYLLMQDLSWIFLAGFDTGYLLYSWVHYSVHTRKGPSFLKPLWKHHYLHHYKYPEKAFGVSSRLWDRIFYTMPPQGPSGPSNVKVSWLIVFSQ